ncbi:MAG TPA: hypothetical protein VIX37_06410 [Candidatus Sulfotelmatobacter sp.]
MAKKAKGRATSILPTSSAEFYGDANRGKGGGKGRKRRGRVKR